MNTDAPLTTIQLAMAPTPWDYAEPEETDALVFALQEFVRELQSENADLLRKHSCGICGEEFSTDNINCGGDCQRCVKDAEVVSHCDTTPAADSFEQDYFHYGLWLDGDYNVVHLGVTTATEWDTHGCCKDGYTDDEADRIYDVMQRIGAVESMESIFEVPGKTVDDVRQCMAEFNDWRHNQDFTVFLLECNT